MSIRVPGGEPLRKAVTAVVVASIVATMATLAVLFPGFATADVSLNDGGLWVTRSADLMIGHLNYPSHALDGGLHSTTADFTLFQDGNDVQLYDAASGAIVRVDPAKVATAESGSLTPNSRVDSRAGTLAIIDAQTNGLFVAATASLQGLSTTGRDPIAELDPGSAVAVGVTGTVFAVSASKHQLFTVTHAQDKPIVQDLPAFGSGASLAITAVGDVPVVFDSANGVIYTPGRTISLPEGKQGKLQVPSAANSAVVIASAAGLISQPLDGSPSTLVGVASGGVPSTPTWLAGCAYGVWSGTGAYVRDCPGQADDDVRTLPGVGSSPQLTLRQNRSVLVVNELVQGTTWLVNDAMVQVNNWTDVIPPESDNGKEDSKDKQDQFKLPERSQQNHRPDAVNDKFGVRAGATTVLPVLDNDTDPDGDLLVASLVGQAPDGVTVQSIRDGAALQVSLGKNVSGSPTFKYQVNDGRPNGTDEAVVTLDVHGSGQNAPPAQHKIKTVQLEIGSKVSVDALQGWYDPDGDDIFLKAAKSSTDQVTYRSNGVIQITESAGERGIREVQLVVSDGTDDYTGTLRIDVRPKRTLPPIANSDRVSTTVGQAITVNPLANDASPNSEQLRLAKVPQIGGTRIVADYASGNFTFTSAVAGTYYVPYLVANGGNASSALVRVDVKAKGADGLDPVAARDTALLPNSRDVLVDVLNNDSDPAGGILVVQSVTVPEGSRVSAEVLEHRVVRVRDVGGLNAPVTLTYRVSNGSRWADGEIRVMPVKLPEKLSAPVAVDDQATVRAGDIVTVDVLGNDYHPDGDKLTLLPQLLETPDAGDGVAFVSEGKVRFKAGPAAKQVSMVYQVSDSADNVASARLKIQIIGADDGNAAPRPQALTARVIAGTSVRVPVPLDGIDPNGDSVELLGTGSAPSKGQVSVGASWLVYQAYPGTTGADSFDYVVRDRLGSVATGSVVVGIAAPSSLNQAPYTALDQVSVRPGRSVSIAVLANDSDPDGDKLTLLAKGLSAPAGVNAKVVKDRVEVTAPTTEGSYAITYTAADSYGATSPGNIVLKVAKDSPLQAPIARDDRVPATDIAEGKKTVVANVLANDEDPDGVASTLTVTADDPNAVVHSDGSVEVPVAKANQLILYTVTDGDSLTSSAALFVPGTDSLVPTLKSTEPLQVESGKQLRINLDDLVLVRPGHTPKVADADSAKAGNGNGDPLVVDQKTVQYTSVAGWYGRDAVSVTVTDGENANDSQGNTAYVTIPLQVNPSSNVSPSLAGTSVQVAPGDGSAEVNLRKLASDPNPGDLAKLSFRVTDIPPHVRTDLAGDVLTVSADSSAAQGSVSEIAVEASDGVTAPGAAKIAVTVVSSQRPLPVAVDDVVPSAFQGKPVTVDVLANDQPNPFPDVPLTVIDARVLSGKGTADTDGKTVVVTPDASFVGTMQVRYRIEDATKAPDRQAEATISVTVQGRPDQPTRPVVNSVGDRMVVLSWTPPANNGRPITGYTVASAARGFTQKCGTTTCTLNNLKNNVEYTFTVVATNEVGDSDPSQASAVARPDVKPDQPQPPVLKFDDRALDVTWKTPHTSGSPVTSYSLQISPAPDSGSPQVDNVTGNSYRWSGLTNGVSYVVRVQAFSLAPDPSDWSGYSTAEVPAGKPQAPAKPVTEAASPVGSQAQIKVSWDAVTGDAANGDPIADYTLVVYQGGSEVNRFTVGGTSKAVNLDPSQTDFTFKVSARNKAGSSPLSAASSPRRAALAPGAPKNVQLTPHDGSVKVTFDDGALNGNKSSELTYHYQLTPSGKTGTVDSGGSIDSLTNGTPYKISLWATSSVAGVEKGDSATSNSATPFGKPQIYLDGIDRLDNAVRFRWHVDSNGRSLTSSNPGVDGSGNGSVTKGGLPAGGSTTLDVSYSNEAGTSTASWSGQANDPPPPHAEVVGVSGTTARISFSNWGAETRTIRCWAAKTWDDRNWKDQGYNYAGEIPNVSIPANGTISVSCPDDRDVMNSGKPFSIELLGEAWVGWITIP